MSLCYLREQEECRELNPMSCSVQGECCLPISLQRELLEPCVGPVWGSAWVWECLLDVGTVTESVPEQLAPARHSNKMGLVSEAAEARGVGVLFRHSS